VRDVCGACSRKCAYFSEHIPCFADLRRWIASEKSTRIPIESFGMALSLHGVQVDSEEVECMVANMIYRVRRVHQYRG
jgi:hypothetical protein